MQTLHRLTFHTTDEIRRELTALDVVVGADGFTTIEVDEAHPRWEDLQVFVTRRRIVDIVTTQATAEECAAATWLVVEPAWHAAYPQPEEHL